MMIMLRRLDRSEDLRTTMLRLRGGSGSWCNANGDEPWRGDDPGDETEREISLWVSKPVKTSGPRGIGKRAAHWLFVKATGGWQSPPNLSYPALSKPSCF